MPRAVQHLERCLLRPGDVAEPRLGEALTDRIRHLNTGQVVAADMQQSRDLNSGINLDPDGPGDQQPQPRPVSRGPQPGPVSKKLSNRGLRAHGE